MAGFPRMSGLPPELAPTLGLLLVTQFDRFVMSSTVSTASGDVGLFPAEMSTTLYRVLKEETWEKRTKKSRRTHCRRIF